MRKFLDLVESAAFVFERYTADNKYFLNYMRDGKFDPYGPWDVICNWIEEEGYLEEVSEILGKEIPDADELNEEGPEIFYQLPDWMQKEADQYTTQYLMQHDPAELATTVHMALRTDKLVPRETWLVHFSDHADSISREGFRFGIDQMDKLGLTNYFSDSEKKYGGYNFAFAANSFYANTAASQNKYGSHAVLFQNSGVEAWHHGDEEAQIVFHGTDVDPRDIILLIAHDGEWIVKPKRRLKSGRDFLYKGEYRNCVNWVQTNFEQYRRALSGR